MKKQKSEENAGAGSVVSDDLFGIRVSRFRGWGGEHNPPTVWMSDNQFPTREKAESAAYFMRNEDRFGGIRTEVVPLPNDQDHRPLPGARSQQH